MHSIKIQVASRILYILRYASVVFLSLTFSFLVCQAIGVSVSENEVLFLGLVFLLFYLFDWLIGKFYRGWVRLSLRENGLEVTWLKQIALQKRSNLVLAWSDIKDQLLQPDPHFHVFRIRLKDGRVFKLNIDTEDETFEIFLAEFSEFLKVKSE